MTFRKHRSTLPRAAALALVALSSASTLTACGGDFGSGGFGVTQGGVQDNRYARQQIEAGQIPSTEGFKAEGVFSEHDLPFTKSLDCEVLLCPQTALARHQPLVGAGEQLLIHVGFATGQQVEDFERRPLNLSLAVDISGSMTGAPIQAVRQALRTMVDQLGEEDRVSIVAFDDEAELRLKATAMDESGRASMRKAIDKLESRGGTNIEAGLKLAYKQVSPSAGDPDVEDRVMLLTDAQPNVGATDPGSFLGMIRSHAESEIGASIFGVGVDLGAELAQEMSTVRGGSYFYLTDEEAIASVFDDEFDTIVTPVAYDFEASVRAQAGWTFGEAYGASLDQPSEGVQIGASTLFLSKRNGGIGVTLRPGEGGELPESAESVADFDLSYLPQGSDELIEQYAAVPWSGGLPYQASFVVADDLGAFKMAVLIDEYLALEAGSDFCEGALGQEEAATLADEAAERLGEIATALADDLLARDAAVMTKLAENIRVGRERCLSGGGGYL